MPSFSDYAAESKETDLKKILEGYRGQTHLDLMKSGEYDDEIVGEIDQELAQIAADNGIEIKTSDDFRTQSQDPHSDSDLRNVSRYSTDPYAAASARTYLAMRDPASKVEGDDTYDSRLEAAKLNFDSTANSDLVNQARRQALNSGDLPFSITKSKDSTTGEEFETLEISPTMAAAAGDDKALADIFEKNPELPRHMIPAVRQKLATPEGYNKPRFQIERNSDFLKGLGTAAGKDTTIATRMVDLQAAVNQGKEDNLEPQIGQIASQLSTQGFGGDYSADEIKEGIRDALTLNRRATSTADAVRFTSTGQAVIPSLIQTNKAEFEKALASGTIPEAQKEALIEQRQTNMQSYAKDTFRILKAREPREFNPFYKSRKEGGQSDVEIMDAWAADPKHEDTTWDFSMPRPKDLISATDTVSGVWDALRGLGEGAPAAYYQLQEGFQRPDKYSPEAKAAFKDFAAFQKEMQDKDAENLADGTGTSVGEAFRGVGPSLPMMGASLIAAIPAGMAGAKVGAGVGTAVAGPGGTAAGALIGGAVASTAASAPIMYRMMGAAALNDWWAQAQKASQEKNGRDMNEAEMRSTYENLKPIAENTALWEAGTEAVSTALTLGAGKIIFGLGKPLAKNFATALLYKEAVKKAEYTLGQKAAAFGVEQLGEYGGETATQMAQSADEKKATATIAGKSTDGINSDWSMAGAIQAFKDVAPTVAATSVLLGGLGAGVKVASKVTGIGDGSPDYLKDVNMIMPDQEAPATFDEIRAAAEFTPAASGSQGLKDGVMLNRQAAILRQATTLDEANSPATAQALRDSARALAPDPAGESHAPESAAATSAGPEAEALPERPNGLSKNAGWKLHLGTDSPEKVSDYLKKLGVPHKLGRSGGQTGKDVTVYIGDKDMATAIANKLEKDLGDILKSPEGDALTTNRAFNAKVSGRFDAAGDSDFHQYGSDGIPELNAAVQNRTFGGLDDLTENLKKADALLQKKYGAFYGGKPTLATPPLTDEPTPQVPDVVDPGSGLILDSKAQAGLAAALETETPNLGEIRSNLEETNDSEQPTESSQSQVPVPAVPGSEQAADPASEAVAAPASAPVDAGVAAKTPTLTPEARSSIDREVSSAKVALTSVAHKRAVVAELEVALKDVKVPMTTKVDGKNATAQFEESGAKMVAQLKRDKDAYKALADCLGSK